MYHDLCVLCHTVCAYHVSPPPPPPHTHPAVAVIALVYTLESDGLHVGSTHGLLLLYGPAIASQCYWVQQLARRTRAAVQIMLLLQFMSIVTVIVSRYMQGVACDSCAAQ